MHENSVIWHAVRRNLGPLGHVVRVENACETGTPDVYYALRIGGVGISGWLELKILAASGRAPKHLTLDQVLWGRAEVSAGGKWHMLCRSGQEWLLHDVDGAAALFKGETTSTPIFRQAAGKFPLALLIAAIRVPTTSSIFGA